MHYHLIVSNRCNLECSYCGGTRLVEPLDMDYPVEDLASFIAKDPDPVINFYGGEPLLRIDKIKEVMDKVPAKYVIQTNGLLLPKLEGEYINRFHTILLSLDGDREITDRHRGKGAYDQVMEAVKHTQACGFKGDLVARMTVSPDGDIFRDVKFLAYTGMFDHIHWQLDFQMFWEGGEDLEKVKDWIENSYNPGITKLVDLWVVQLFRQRDLGPVPLIVLGKALLDGRDSKLWCGSGLDFWGITTDGRLTACPVNLEDEELMCGDIHCEPEDCRNKVQIVEPCLSCDIYGFCGGRCLLMNRNQDNMPEGAWELMCTTVRHLKKELESALPDLKDVYRTDSFVRSVLDYPDFNNSTEIVP